MTETFSERLPHANPLKPSPLTKRAAPRTTVSVSSAPPLSFFGTPLPWNQTVAVKGCTILSILPFAVTRPQSFSTSSRPRSSLSGAISSGWLLISPHQRPPLTSILLQGGLQMRHTPGYTAHAGETCILSGMQEDNVRFQDSALPNKSRGPEGSRILFSLMSPY